MEIFVILIFIVVIIAVIIATTKLSENKKRTKEHADEKYEETVETDKRVAQFELKKTLAAEDSRKRTPAAQGRSTIIAPTINTNNKIGPKIVSSLKQIKSSHGHPAASGNYRQEVVDVGGSMGGEITEGCAEHYFTRFVKISDESKQENQPNTELIKAIILGDALEHPKFKK